MNISRRYEGDYAVVAVVGEIHLYLTPDLREVLDDVFAQGYHNIMVDMSKVDYIDSSCLGVFIGYMKTTRQAGGDFYLFNISAQVQNLLLLTKLIHMFRIYDSEAEAAQALRSTPSASQREADGVQFADDISVD